MKLRILITAAAALAASAGLLVGATAATLLRPHGVPYAVRAAIALQATTNTAAINDGKGWSMTGSSCADYGNQSVVCHVVWHGPKRILCEEVAALYTERLELVQVQSIAHEKCP